MKWSSPISICAPLSHEIPNSLAVYRLITVSPEGKSIPIARVFGNDPVGQILIGETTECARRFEALVRSAVQGKFGHGPGLNYHEWIGYHQYVPDNVRFQYATHGIS